ncbi:hypothetical protein [Congregibacter sp.]|uniref:hypothetical protein n=1 Tax=Congregibacter sp. TaxID=2744308 RepID=UPI0039E601F3
MTETDDNKSSKPALATKTKAAMRQELEQATQKFLHVGGEVNNVPRGATAWTSRRTHPGARSGSHNRGSARVTQRVA